MRRRAQSPPGRVRSTSVAIRRDAGSRLIAVTLAVLAKRARAAIRLGGMCAAAGKVMPMPRTSSSRRSARINAGPLTMTGPERN